MVFFFCQPSYGLEELQMDLLQSRQTVLHEILGLDYLNCFTANIVRVVLYGSVY